MEGEEGKKKHYLPLPFNECSFLIAIVSCLDTKMKKLNAVARKPLDRPLTFEQMVACCQRNWTLRENFLSRKERRMIFCIDHVKNFMQFSTITRVTGVSDRKRNILDFCFCFLNISIVVYYLL